MRGKEPELRRAGGFIGSQRDTTIDDFQSNFRRVVEAWRIKHAPSNICLPRFLSAKGTHRKMDMPLGDLIPTTPRP